MGSDAVRRLFWLWLLPAMAAGRVLRQYDELDEPRCRVYSLGDLRHLDCSDQGLESLPDGLDYSAQVLLLSNNNFKTFPAELEYFSQVEVLDLSGNLLSHSLPSYFENLHSLNTLNLSNNNYEVWASSGQYNMRALDLSKNKISGINHNAFKEVPNLHFLDLSENRIHNLLPTIFTEAKSLNSLILSRNYFVEFPKFESHSLRSVSLSSCQILKLDFDSFKGMYSLLEIDLSINQIEEIPNNLGSNTLQDLDLSYNEIRLLTDRSLSSLPHLAVLDLRGNEFREVWSTSLFASNPFLREVYVKGNRWSCEGFSVNLLLTYEFLTKDPPKIADPASLICYTPSNVTQMSWQRAYIETWHADESSTDSYVAMAVMIGIIIGVIITSLICRGFMSLNKPEPPRPIQRDATVLNVNGITQPRVESVVMRVPLHEEDLPPSYDEALLMPRLNSSFHSLPDFIDEDETPRQNRRSRSIGDLTEYRPRADRRSVRRTVEIHIA